MPPKRVDQRSNDPDWRNGEEQEYRPGSSSVLFCVRSAGKRDVSCENHE